ncbi:HPr family phosphocarrier protein [Tepidibacter thalassicus]|uniref:Phosphocarrier protein n=1 Tax=Tepidibacter thalassicus DSM 15285 TaxID=1123350 RepID=A0A1M5QHJ6_9FIRM|nr:HPr family phosphocarrier protein [Tepidibacter thalassicus]SHH12993.1 phosphocarrier protein [Tepidibacter thalassicus DSM 15285]
MEKKVIIKNESGIHARPAGVFVKKASEFKSQVEIVFNGKKVNAKSIMGLMSLGLSKGDEITIVANGEDAQNAVNELAALVESGFGEI